MNFKFFQREWAMQMLLNSRENCRINALRACLLASDVSSEGAQSMIKLVATDLIANNCLTGNSFSYNGFFLRELDSLSPLPLTILATAF